MRNPSMNRLFLIMFAAISIARAAEGGATLIPIPALSVNGPAIVGGHEAHSAVSFPRPLSAFEVEIITVKKNDPASVEAWTLLAAQGYHVAAAVPGEGGVAFYLERSAGNTSQGAWQLPSLLNQDKRVADGIHVKIKDMNDERQRAAHAGAVPAPATPTK